MHFALIPLACFALSSHRVDRIQADPTAAPDTTPVGVQASEKEQRKDLEASFLANEPGTYKKLIGMGEAALPILIRVLQNKDAGTAQFMAANALGEIGLPACVDPLIKGLEAEWFNVRRCSALALGQIGDWRAKGPLGALMLNDPYVWVNRETGEKQYLVREDAKRALDLMSNQRVTYLDSAENLPPPSYALPEKRLEWPFPGGFKKQQIYNNYQQPTDGYVHAALDLLQKPGTPVLAVEAGTVAFISTNYPDWTTHHFFVVEPEAGSGEGWCYTHVNPETYQFEVGDTIEAGQRLGEVVKFSLGDRPGVDHLHLAYVRYLETNGKYELTPLYDPLQRFHWKDDQAPTIHTPFWFVPQGSLEPLAKTNGQWVLSGKVNILAAISDRAFKGHIANWMTPYVTIEISWGTGDNTPSTALTPSSGNKLAVAPWRKLVLDQRGPITNSRITSPLYLSYRERQPFTEQLPRNPVAYVLNLTHTDGDGVIEKTDRKHCWNTTEMTTSIEGGEGNSPKQPRFPNGSYTVIVRAWDMAGNRTEARMPVIVNNE